MRAAGALLTLFCWHTLLPVCVAYTPAAAPPTRLARRAAVTRMESITAPADRLWKELSAVQIFSSTPTCPASIATKNCLDEMGITYTEYDCSAEEHEECAQLLATACFLASPGRHTHLLIDRIATRRALQRVHLKSDDVLLEHIGVSLLRRAFACDVPHPPR